MNHMYSFRNQDRCIEQVSMTSDLISIIVPCYNSKIQNLLALFNSIQNSIRSQDQVFWVDDGSTQRSAFEFLEERLHQDKRHVFIKLEKNEGVSAAINKGIRRSQIDSFIITIAHDDKVHSGYLSEVRNIFKNNPLVDIIVPNISQFGEKSGIIKSGLKNKLTNIFSLLLRL